jgi:hypothetical protein
MGNVDQTFMESTKRPQRFQRLIDYDLVKKVQRAAKQEVFDDLRSMGYGFENFSAGNKKTISEPEWNAFVKKHLG